MTCKSRRRSFAFTRDSTTAEIPSASVNLPTSVTSASFTDGVRVTRSDITEPLKDDICKSIKRWRNSFSALKLKQEILYCLFDQIIHSADNVDILELFKHLHPKVMLGLPMLEGTNPASCFPSSVIGYEAACYSRIWSKVFAADIFASKFGKDVSNHHVGMQFRNKVLAPGGSKDPIEVLSAFLGREPSIQAYINSFASCTS